MKTAIVNAQVVCIDKIIRNGVCVFENGKINAYSDKKIIASYSVDDFSRRPGAVFRKLQSQVITSNNS